jgi:GT2 family glycosyltransferase
LKSFSIIIVTWNGLHHLKTFLPSVVETEYSDFEIIIADNNSTDGTKEWLAETFPEVKIAEFDNNYGYTGGNNRAVPFATNDILLFLNNDVEVTPNWLDSISQTFELDTNIAIVQPKLRSYKEPELFEYAGAAGGFLDTLGYPFCQGRILDSVEADNGQFDEIREITWASGAAIAVKKEVFEQLGGFDEDFEFHMEEIDLCWRAINSSHKIVYTPGSTVYHLGGGSLPMGSTRKVYYNFRNSLFMLWKNLPVSQLWYKIFLRLILDGVAAFRSLISGRPGELIAILKAHIHFYTKLPLIHKKRKQIGIKSKEVLRPVLIIWHYFLRGKKTYNDIMH